MQAIDRQLAKIINGTTQFIIPVFQRDFSWTETECDQLWRDIIAVSSGGPETRHFLGSIVYVQAGDIAAGFTRWLLIDGQQRLTSVVLLLIALRDHIIKVGWGPNDGDPTANQIDAYFLKNPHEPGRRKNKLVLRRHDQDTLNSLVHGLPLPDDPSSRLIQAYEFFLDRLSDAAPDAVYRGIGRLVIVDVTLDHSDAPQLVFESLNSTGMDLTQADLIRNFVLMRLSEQEQTRLYEHYWSQVEGYFRDSPSSFDSFARDFVALNTMANKQERANNIYRGFRAFFPEWTQRRGGLEEALQEFRRAGEYYARFVVGTDIDDPLEHSLVRLRRLVDVPAILVMRLFDCYERAGTLTEQGFIEALTLLESYVIRRAICGLQTRGYWQIFANIAYRLMEDAPLDGLRVAFARQHEKYRFPDDEEFGRELELCNLYGMRICWHVLERLENYDTREPADVTAYSIEHIMPQNPRLSAEWRSMLGSDWRRVHQEWLHRVGNLTLTGYNSSYSDRPFEDKKTVSGGFNESAVRLNRYVREQREWNEETIRERTEMLAQKALAVWPPLKVNSELIRAAEQRELQERAVRSDPATVKMTDRARELYGTLRDLIKELDPNVLELAEAHSVSYHGPTFFLEVLPRRDHLILLFPLEFREIQDPHGIAVDESERSNFARAKYEGGVSVSVYDPNSIIQATPLIQQARTIISA